MTGRDRHGCDVLRRQKGPISRSIDHCFVVRTLVNSFLNNLFDSVASVWMQVRVALAVGVSSDDESVTIAESEVSVCPHGTALTVRSLDGYAGYLRRNGLGSLDIGSVRSDLGE